MPRSRRPMPILVAVALLTLVAVATADTQAGAWERFTDTRSDDLLGEAPLEGKTFWVVVQCFGLFPYKYEDVWLFLPGGELLSEIFGQGSTWEQTSRVSWNARLNACYHSDVYFGISLGRRILGIGGNYVEIGLLVTGIEVGP